MHDKIQLARSRHQLAKLLGLAKEQEKALAENPKPFLDKAYEEISRCRQILNDIRAAANGTDQMLTPPPPGPPPFISIQEDLNQRLQRVQKILAENPD